MSIDEKVDNLIEYYMSLPKEEVVAMIEEKFPDLTLDFPFGGTRTTYTLLQLERALANNDELPSDYDPGAIESFQNYTDTLLQKYWDQVEMAMSWGVKNFIIPMFTHESFKKGETYMHQAIAVFPTLVQESSLRFWADNNIDPYFVGFDTLLAITEDPKTLDIISNLKSVQKNWNYDPSHKKLIIDFFSIPLFTLAEQVSTIGIERLNELINEAKSSGSLLDMFDIIYSEATKILYGVSIPRAHFSIASNKHGSFHKKNINVLTLDGGYCRDFYIPYPHAFMTENTWKRILVDMICDNTRAKKQKYDLTGDRSLEDWKNELIRVKNLADNSENILGLLRSDEF